MGSAGVVKTASLHLLALSQTTNNKQQTTNNNPPPKKKGKFPEFWSWTLSSKIMQKIELPPLGLQRKITD